MNTELRIKNVVALLFVVVSLCFFFVDTTEAQTNTISLVWQADTYTPPFYQGKALHTGGSSYEVIALPPSGYTTQNLVFTWEKDARTLGSLSGRGQNVLSLEGGVVNSVVDIRVIVSTPAGTELGRGRIVLAPQDPRVVLYQRDPARGTLFEHALSSFSLTDDEITVEAVPYFFSDTPSTLLHVWRLNSEQLPEEQNFVVTLRRPEEESGQSTLSFSVEHPQKFMQEAQTSATIMFTEQ